MILLFCSVWTPAVEASPSHAAAVFSPVYNTRHKYLWLPLAFPQPLLTYRILNRKKHVLDCLLLFSYTPKEQREQGFLFFFLSDLNLSYII